MQVNMVETVHVGHLDESRRVDQKDTQRLGPFPRVLLPQPWILVSRLLGEKKVYIMHSLPKT